MTPPSRKATRYRQHVDALAHDLRVEVEYRTTARGGYAYRRARRIKTPEIRGQTTYLTAMHELGHIAIKPEPARRLDQETAAWEWALANMMDVPTLASWKSIKRSLDWYFTRGYLGAWGTQLTEPFKCFNTRVLLFSSGLDAPPKNVGDLRSWLSTNPLSLLYL